MPGVARVIADRSGAPIIQALAPTVFVDNKQIAVKGALITPYGDGCQSAPRTGTGSSTVFANNLPVIRAGDKDICGTPISPGSQTVIAG